MTAKYRGSHEIMSAILESCSAEGGVVQTKVMYEAYVSHAQLKHYLSHMEERGLIVRLNGKIMLTANGKRAFELFQELDGILRV